MHKKEVNELMFPPLYRTMFAPNSLRALHVATSRSGEKVRSEGEVGRLDMDNYGNVLVLWLQVIVPSMMRRMGERRRGDGRGKG